MSTRHTDHPVVIATVVALLRDSQGRVLLVKRPHEPFLGHWSLPGGHIDPGETAEEAMVREVKEETGLTLNAVRVLGTRDEIAPKHQWFAVAQIFCGDVTGELHPGPGEGEAKWFSVDEAVTLPLAFTHAEILRDYAGTPLP